jgi:NitT/TauT family transport system ATP-binding protein
VVPEPSASIQPKLRCQDLVKHYGDRLILDHVSFDVPAGEFLCIVGPSGCGKTTLLRILHGLVDHDGGQVLLDGAPVLSPPPTMAMVFQQFGLFPWKTVYENVAFPLVLQGLDRQVIHERVQAAIELVGLAGAERHYPAQLSGGMSQRTGLARALAAQADVLLMDEPFASVDAQTREVLQEELLNIWRRHRRTVIFITHSIDEAITLGQRVLVLSAHPGRVHRVLEVPIEEPRSVQAVRRHPRYVPLREAIWEALQGRRETS